MIIACEQCQTQFQLDDRRIPSGGARVRCSKCQHAFFVRPPEVEAETTLQGLVDQVVEEAIPAPEPETDTGFGQTDPALSEALESVDEVPPDEWTFNEDPGPDGAAALEIGDPSELDPQLDSGSGLFGEPGDLGSSGTFRQSPYEVPDNGVASSSAAVAPEDPPAPAPASRKAPAGFELEGEGSHEPEAQLAGADPAEDLGAPESWDFLADVNPAPVEHVEEAPQEAPEAVAEPRSPRRRRRPLWFVPDSGTTAAAWLLGLALIGWGAAQVVRAALAPMPTAEVAVVQVGGGSLPEGLRAERLENLHGGSILLVSGRAPAGARAGQGLRIRLLDAAGAPLEAAPAWAGPALVEEPLRETDPSDLRRTFRQTSPSLRAGSAFQAVFEHAPIDAHGLELRWAEPEKPGAAEASAAAGPPGSSPAGGADAGERESS